MRQVALVAGSLAAAAVLWASAGTGMAAVQHPTAMHAVSSAASSVQMRGIRWGTARFVLGAVVRNLTSFEQATSTKPAVRVMFMPWRTPFYPARAIRKNASLGAQTVLELQPRHFTMRQIGSGQYDHWLRTVFAKHVAALRIPVTISFASEMNGQWYSWGSGHTKPSIYVRAWRHVHNLLSGTKAGRLITWLWQPSAIHFSTPSPLRWWPGSRYVNVIGLDGYYVLPTDNFKIIFAQTIKLMRRVTHRPIMVGETSIGTLTGRALPDMRDLFAGIRSYHLRGLVWFNIRQSAGLYHEDWRLQDHPRVLREFRHQVAVARTLLR